MCFYVHVGGTRRPQGRIKDVPFSDVHISELFFVF